MDAEAGLLGEEPEVLEADPRRLWRPTRWVTVAFVLALLLGAGAWHVDRQSRVRESEALDACRRALHDAVISSDLQLMSAATVLRPTLASATGSRREAVLDRMSLPARQVLAEVLRADRMCRSISIPVWHRGLRAGRDAATAYSHALVARVREIADDGAHYYDHDNRALRRLRTAADVGVFGGGF